jgi:ribonuclease BN (tRNA processing enzyme)
VESLCHANMHGKTEKNWRCLLGELRASLTKPQRQQMAQTRTVRLHGNIYINFTAQKSALRAWLCQVSPNALNTVLKITQLMSCLPVCTDQIVTTHTHTHTHTQLGQLSEWMLLNNRTEGEVYCVTCLYGLVTCYTGIRSHAVSITGNSRFDPPFRVKIEAPGVALR